MAFRALSEPGAADRVWADYHGSLTNNSTDDHCAFALYEFDTPPARSEILPVIVGETPPEVHPGGGRLIHHGVLPRVGEHAFVISLAPAGAGDIDLAGGDASELDATVVLALCEQADVELELVVELILCERSDLGPPTPANLVEQLWSSPSTDVWSSPRPEPRPR